MSRCKCASLKHLNFYHLLPQPTHFILKIFTPTINQHPLQSNLLHESRGVYNVTTLNFSEIYNVFPDSNNSAVPTLKDSTFFSVINAVQVYFLCSSKLYHQTPTWLGWGEKYEELFGIMPNLVETRKLIHLVSFCRIEVLNNFQSETINSHSKSKNPTSS